MKKIIVYVKHYLTPIGINYFQENWFPRVMGIVKQQDGFLTLTHEIGKESPDCVHLTLYFENEEKLEAWIAHPSHQGLVEALDPYRSREYWKALRTLDEQTEPSILEWKRITLKTTSIEEEVRS